MSFLKRGLVSVVGSWVFKRAKVSRLTDPSPHFRLIDLEGSQLQGAHWFPGDKLQVHVGEGELRTYTPLLWDAAQGKTRLLAYLHGSTPAVDWVRALKVGEECQLFGPRRSLDVPEGPAVLFGDETSLAVAYAVRHRPSASAQDKFVFESSTVTETQNVLRALELSDAHVFPKQEADKHLVAASQQLLEGGQELGRANLLLTGRARSIQRVRRELAHARDVFPTHRVRAYWAEGKVGMD